MVKIGYYTTDYVITVTIDLEEYLNSKVLSTFATNQKWCEEMTDNTLCLCYLGSETSQKFKYQYRDHLVGQLQDSYYNSGITMISSVIIIYDDVSIIIIIARNIFIIIKLMINVHHPGL